MVSDTISNLALGFGTALTVQNLGFAFFGVTLGTLVGILPGIGPVSTVAMLLPMTFALDPSSALIMLAGLYYGAQYGGSTTAILVNMPGESSAVVTCIDGFQMARNGRAGDALAIAAIGSFLAGTFATLVIAFFTPWLASLASSFGSPDYLALMLLGIVTAIVLARGSVLKAVAMLFLGFLLGMVGVDPNSGAPRFSLGLPHLYDGIDFVPIALAFFGLPEVISNLANRNDQTRTVQQARFKLLPSMSVWRRAWPAIVRGTGIGSIVGVLPGGGAVLGSFASYVLEKKISRHPEQFGKGAVEGVAGPESANNAGAQTSFIPMFTLGIPANPVMALMLGALMIQGVVPGPMIMDRPELFWGVIASMWVGNLMLLVLNLPLIGLWVRLLSIPYSWLFPMIFILSCIGIYSVNNSSFDIWQAVVLTGLAYVLIRIGCEAAPLVLGFVLGPWFEEHLRRSLLIHDGDFLALAMRPIGGTVLCLSVIMIVVSVLPAIRKRRDDVFVED